MIIAHRAVSKIALCRHTILPTSTWESRQQTFNGSLSMYEQTPHEHHSKTTLPVASNEDALTDTSVASVCSLSSSSAYTGSKEKGTICLLPASSSNTASIMTAFTLFTSCIIDVPLFHTWVWLCLQLIK